MKLVSILYNDAAVDRNSRGEEAIGRMSEMSRDRLRSGEVTAPFARVFTEPYHCGDPLTLVHQFNTDEADNLAICEKAFELLNIAHPEGWSHRSMSMGDLVTITDRGERIERTSYACAALGFTEVDVPDLAVVAIG